MLARSHRLLLEIDLLERASKYSLMWDIGLHELYKKGEKRKCSNNS